MEYRWEIEEMSLEPSPPEGESSAAADLPKETFSILRQEAQIKQKTKSNTNKMKSLEEKIAQLMTTNDSLIDDAQNDLYYDDSSEDEHTPVKDQYSAMEN